MQVDACRLDYLYQFWMKQSLVYYHTHEYLLYQELVILDSHPAAYSYQLFSAVSFNDQRYQPICLVRPWLILFFASLILTVSAARQKNHIAWPMWSPKPTHIDLS